MISLRPAGSDDAAFALNPPVETIKPSQVPGVRGSIRTTGAGWALRLADDRRVITYHGEDTGWVEVRQTGGEVLPEKLYISPSRQRQGIGTRVIQRLAAEPCGKAKPTALFVLKTNPAFRTFCRRHGFGVVQETAAELVMRRTMDQAA